MKLQVALTADFLLILTIVYIRLLNKHSANLQLIHTHTQTHTHTHTHTHKYNMYICPPGYHHNGFVATHALGHMMYGLNDVRFVPLIKKEDCYTR